MEFLFQKLTYVQSASKTRGSSQRSGFQDTFMARCWSCPKDQEANKTRRRLGSCTTSKAQVLISGKRKRMSGQPLWIERGRSCDDSNENYNIQTVFDIMRAFKAQNLVNN